MNQLSLLTSAESIEEIDPAWYASGLYLLPDFITAAEEQNLLTTIDSEYSSRWSSELQRRVQHYGYRYDYKRARLSKGDAVEPLPPWSVEIGDRLVEVGLFSRAPDQMIVNEYLPGQGIAAHIDRPDCFDDMVASLSLGSDAVMVFTDGRGKGAQVFLTRRSVIAIGGLARYRWKHQIPARGRDTVRGRVLLRGRRVSLTFRNVLLGTGDGVQGRGRGD